MRGALKIAFAVDSESPFSQLETKRIRAAVGDYDMPTTPYWCGVMERARKARDINQGELAAAVGCKQPTIHEIEKGKVGGSKYIPAICEALGIPLPIMLSRDEYDERWLEVGRLMRAVSLKRFMRYLENFEDECGITPDSDDASEDQGDDLQLGDGGVRQRALGPSGESD